MVYLKRSGTEFDAAAATHFPVNIDAAAEEREHGHLIKRSKLSNSGNNMFDISLSQYNPLDEPSPLGLRLKKSPSLLDLIQMRLSQANGSSSVSNVPLITPKSNEKKSVKGNTSSAATTEKLKASNFPAMQLSIGGWEFVSKFDGDLVAKCYFAKHKLVWEILQNGLKSKIEIQWADITALKANLPIVGPGTLSITLGRPPHFFKETNPQPRKHTLWQASSDFTDGKASIFRQHILHCPAGVLNKHYEKLIQCDNRLDLVSKQPDFINQSIYFEDRVPFFKNPNAPTIQEIDQLNTSKRSPIDASSPSSSFNPEEQNSFGLTPENVSLEAPSPSSVIDLRGSEGNSNQGEEKWEQLNALGIHKSMSMRDLMDHIDQCISERKTNPNNNKESLGVGEDVFENLAHFLFDDTPFATNSDENKLFATNSDENKLMSRVNSLCCLLQEPNGGPNLDNEINFEGITENEKSPMGMSRKDSFSNLLLNLPRITSLPNFLFNISEDDDENQAK